VGGTNSTQRASNGSRELPGRVQRMSSRPFTRWVEFVPPTRAGFQGGHAGYPGGNAGTVWFELARDAAAATVLHVRHELPARPEYEALIVPWREAWPRALERLRRYLAPPADARD